MISVAWKGVGLGDEVLGRTKLKSSDASAPAVHTPPSPFLGNSTYPRDRVRFSPAACFAQGSLLSTRQSPPWFCMERVRVVEWRAVGVETEPGYAGLAKAIATASH